MLQEFRTRTLAHASRGGRGYRTEPHSLISGKAGEPAECRTNSQAASLGTRTAMRYVKPGGQAVAEVTDVQFDTAPTLSPGRVRRRPRWLDQKLHSPPNGAGRFPWASIVHLWCPFAIEWSIGVGRGPAQMSRTLALQVCDFSTVGFRTSNVCLNRRSAACAATADRAEAAGVTSWQGMEILGRTRAISPRRTWSRPEISRAGPHRAWRQGRRVAGLPPGTAGLRGLRAHCCSLRSVR